MVQFDRPLLPDMGQPNRTYTYTTQDEIAFLRTFAVKHTVRELEKLRESYRGRVWEGHGMNVDGPKVLAELDMLVACARAVAHGAVLEDMCLGGKR